MTSMFLSAAAPPDAPIARAPGAVADAVARMPARQRQVLLMVAVEGRSYRDVGGRLNLPPGVVLDLLSRAREELRLALAPDGADARRPASSEGASPSAS